MKSKVKVKDKSKRRHEKKWASLNARGFTEPKTPEENERRLREAHHGN